MKIRTKATIATLIPSAILYWVFPSGHIGLPVAEITVGTLSVGIIWIVCYAAFSPTSYKNK